MRPWNVCGSGSLSAGASDGTGKVGNVVVVAPVNVVADATVEVVVDAVDAVAAVAPTPASAAATRAAARTERGAFTGRQGSCRSPHPVGSYCRFSAISPAWCSTS
jgi:hypothetical protein